MKVSKQQAAVNRQRILIEAARLIRERGIAGAGVDALAEAAGLTHGGVYSQFGSKDRLAAEALAHALRASGASLGQYDTLAKYVHEYLSQAHRERLGEGCPLAAVGSEMPRQSDAARESFTAGVRAMADRLARLTADRPGRKSEALAIAATLVGGLILARGVNDPALSQRILAASRASLLPRRRRAPSRNLSRLQRGRAAKRADATPDSAGTDRAAR